MKINVGCGSDYRPGWINIDFRPPADRIGDFTAMQFTGATEILLSHVLEHLSWRRTGDVLMLVHGWLAPGGLLTVEVPDMQEILALGCTYPAWQQWVYGEQSHSGEHHMAGFTLASLSRAVADAGFTLSRVRRFRSTHPLRPGFPCIEVVA
ncbi:MAG: hypothetical protein HY331_19380, partial [Chloroflexi bacterium]|nr:hypothetical protein [Chloroflexota bacterium]